jgi:UDP-glucuronate 4-epimerase
MSRVLITGAGGFIGSQIVGDLAHRGHAITATWRRDRWRLDKMQLGDVRAAQVDLADPQAVAQLIAPGSFDAVVHAAAFVGGAESADALQMAVRDNVLAYANVVSSALRAGCPRILFCSTVSVYGGVGARPGGYLEADASPAGIYGWSKLAGEQILDMASSVDNGLTAVSLRLGGVHGRGRTSGALHAIATAARAGQPIVLREPESRFRWLLIDDLLATIRALLRAPLASGHFVCNLASADTYTLLEIAHRIRSLCGSDSLIETAASAGRNEVMNIDRAVALWGYSPTRIETFLPRYLHDFAAEA